MRHQLQVLRSSGKRLLIEAFPRDTAPKYLLHDRDKIYGLKFRRTVLNIGIEEVRISPHSPWQNPYLERVIGSIRREWLDHMIIFNENHLRRVLREYFRYYTKSRTHLGLGKDCPESRPIELPVMGRVIGIPQVGGLHHRYTRKAAYPARSRSSSRQALPEEQICSRSQGSSRSTGFLSPESCLETVSK